MNIARFTLRTTLSLLVAALGTAAHATTWSSPSSGSVTGTDCKYGSDDYNAGNVCTVGNLSVTAWSNAATGSGFSTGTVTVWGGGFGAMSSSSDYDNPEHAVDNKGADNALLLSFTGLPVMLTQLVTGWSTGDQDITVLAYTGGIGAPVAPNLTASVISTTGSVGSTSGYGTTMTNAYASSNLGGGWTVVGNYAYADQGGSGTTTINLNNSTVSSSYWLVMAYNSAFGTTATGSSSSGETLTNGTADGKYDYFKLQSVSGTQATSTGGGTGQVPEPAILALFGVALLAAGRARRTA